MIDGDGRIPFPQLDPEGNGAGHYLAEVDGLGVVDLLPLVEGTNITFTTDGSALAINSTAGADPAFGAFKGTWSATPDELVWEQDFDVDLSPFTGTGARTAMASAVGTGKPSYNYADQAAATPGANASVNVGTLNLATLPELSGRTPTRVKWWNGQRAVGNHSSQRDVLFQVERGGVVGYTRTLSPNGFGVTITDAWSENECTVAAGNTVNWRITGGTTTPIPTGTFAFTAVRVYAIPVGWSGYSINDYVVYQGQLYVSTTNSNTSTPGAAGATWNLVPIYATPKTANAQVGTTYTLALTDADKTVTMNNAAASTLTVPPNSTVAFPLGSSLTVVQLGAGQLTIAAGAGVTVNGLPTVLAPNRGVRLVKTATDTWQVLPFAVPAAAQAPNAQVGTTYTLALADALRPVLLTNAAAITLTVPTNASVPFPIGTRIPVLQGGAGGVTLSPAAGVTINNNTALTTQWQQVDLLKTGTDTWVVRAAGPAGPTGPTGPAGPPGADATITYATTVELADVDAAAESAGSSATTARGDHKHSVATAVPVALAGSTQTAGTSNSLARADHQHGLPNIPQANITDLVWQSYTPTLGNFTGTITWARYRVIGKSCRVQVMITLDAVPTGRMEVSAPVAFVTGFPTGNGGPIGTVIGNDVGTARRLGATFFLAGSVFVFGSTDVNSFWGIALPHGWVAGDTVAFNAEYEIA